MRIREDVELANISDVGCKREGNEDYFLYSEPEDDDEFARRGRLIVIADGMGGHNAGEVASRLAAEVIRDVYLHTEITDPRQVLIAAFQSAHQAIVELAESDPEMRGMGTTCCAAILRNGLLHYGHIGDSRIYLIRNGKPSLLTSDHTLVANLVRNGSISIEEAEQHPQRNVLTAALGLDSESLAGDFPIEALQLVPGDIILLSTDGLHGLVSAEEMAQASANQRLKDACEELVARAKVRGGHDNITVQMIGVRRVAS
jgi:PPM family protein phosphatase